MYLDSWQSPLMSNFARYFTRIGRLLRINFDIIYSCCLNFIVIRQRWRVDFRCILGHVLADGLSHLSDHRPSFLNFSLRIKLLLFAGLLVFQKRDDFATIRVRMLVLLRLLDVWILTWLDVRVNGGSLGFLGLRMLRRESFNCDVRKLTL